MRRAELRRLLRRADTRAVAAIGGVLVFVLALQALVLYAFAAEEGLEQADDWLIETRELIEGLESHGLSDASLAETVHASLPGGKLAVRVLDEHGALRAHIGRWPEPDRLVPARRDEDPSRRLSSFHLLRRDRFLQDSILLPSGHRLEVALPLKRFAGEAHEIAQGLAIVVALSSLAAFGIAFLATRHAFAPLREGTALLASVDASMLGARLPSRGTGDPVDRHAETLNAVLEDIDAAFSRLRRFSSDVAHELRTPLNRMRSVAGVALETGGAVELRAALERVEQSIDELARMAESLLLIAEVDDRRLPMKPERIDVDAWLRRTAEAWEPAFEERGAKLVVGSAAGVIDADPTLLDRVLSNLLDNAVRHGASGGRVELTAERDGERLRIAVDDAGPGVAESEREHVFERFVRLDRTRRGTTGGLGLALARAVARLLGGDLQLEPSRLGGARFVWWLGTASGSLCQGFPGLYGPGAARAGAGATSTGHSAKLR